MLNPCTRSVQPAGYNPTSGICRIPRLQVICPRLSQTWHCRVAGMEEQDDRLARRCCPGIPRCVGLLGRVPAGPEGMMAVRRLVSFIAATAGLALLVLTAPTAFAQTTSTTSSTTGLTNDHFANATVIHTVPFSVDEDTSQATFDPSDPSECSNHGSVWFAYTPTSEGTIDADTFGSSYDTVLSAWTGNESALSLIACNDD